MQDRYLGQLEPGMDVCDIDGHKVGTVARVYRHADAVVGAGAGASLGGAAPEEILEVKTGLFGLGSHLYIPLGAIGDVIKECVYISRPKDEFDGLGWRDKPAHLDQLA
jgi:hypothetical protein